MRALIISLTSLVAACSPAARPSSPDAGTVEAGCASACGPDGRTVVDCHGDTVQTCGADQGCSAGLCLAACDAAATSSSSVGCDYYTYTPEVAAVAEGGCFAAFVANTWAAPISIAVDRGGVALDVASIAYVATGQGAGVTYAPLPNGQLPPGQVAILFLSDHTSVRTDILTTPCPTGITAAITTDDPTILGTGRGQAFHITTSAPAVAYDIYPYGGANSAVTAATLLLPTSVWSKSYVAVDPYPGTTYGSPTLGFVAGDDLTQITIVPRAPIEGATGVAPGAANLPTTYTLARGEVLQLEQAMTLAGSTVTSDKPIAVFAGSTCFGIPADVLACDGAHQQLPPTRALGDRYAAVRYRDRYPDHPDEDVPWTVVGIVDGTTLAYEPAAPTGAPTTINRGDVLRFWSPGPFTIASQDTGHPFYFAAHMTGCFNYSSDGSDCRGDPEFVNVTPLAQDLRAYTFFADPTYPETDLVFTRERHAGAFADVTLDCLGTIVDWHAIDAGDTVEYARVALDRGNFEAVGACNTGPHVATSAQPFGLTVWGWGSDLTMPTTRAVSYAYPAGAGFQELNTVVIQ